jgi:hypothetical protein
MDMYRGSGPENAQVNKRLRTIRSYGELKLGFLFIILIAIVINVIITPPPWARRVPNKLHRPAVTSKSQTRAEAAGGEAIKHQNQSRTVNGKG